MFGPKLSLYFSEMAEAAKKLSKSAERELKGLGVPLEGTRVTGESRGGVKEKTSRVAEIADKLDQQAKEAAAKRQEGLKESRQLHTPKSGTKSEELLLQAS